MNDSGLYTRPIGISHLENSIALMETLLSHRTAERVREIER